MPTAQSLQAAVYGYTRRTTADTRGVVEQQQAAVRAYAAEHLPGLEVFEDWVDSPSQANRFLSDRTAGRAVMVALERGDHLVVPQYRRAFRRPRDLAALLAVLDVRGVQLHVLDLGVSPLTEAGRTVLAALRALAQADRAAAAESARDQMRRRRIDGKLLNGEAGPGFRLVGPRGNRRRVPDDYERGVQRKIIHWRRSGCTWEGIWRHLRYHKVRTSRGREWSVMKIWRAYQAGLRLEAEEQAVAVPDPTTSPTSSPATTSPTSS
jgi:DNA invertase Pin-like site-specific DNA recombinase